MVRGGIVNNQVGHQIADFKFQSIQSEISSLHPLFARGPGQIRNGQKGPSAGRGIGSVNHAIEPLASAAVRG